MIYSKKNYIYIGGGFLIVLLGYILMIGGGSDDPNVFNNAIFNFQRLTLSPVIILIGFIMVGIGIMSKGKQEEQKEE
ncbi:MAG: hypothetical protein A2X12_07930 [Bacteroidetes bacterium GWE2_29_8]|nr:MAG: hypothetical protein A2X12_07930 [Bacteroidetes bacterium GWE2_29_8]OFY16484.1 MAG: hypothetical protein A2X02_10065 [Bacteroidetes bacterium GWF2_29_10]